MFYSTNNFLWLADFQQNFQQILEEMLMTLDLPLRELNLQTWAGERPNYLESDFDKELAWKTFTFKFFSIKHLPNLEACPTIARLLEKYPQIITAEFSMLEPKTHILPHRGFTDQVLRAHLGLIIPEGDVAIKVGQETKPWRKNEWLIFDDSIVHEAWNQTADRRIVLMIDFEPSNDLKKTTEICNHIISNTNDGHMLGIAPREQWMDWLGRGSFPLKFDIIE